MGKASYHPLRLEFRQKLESSMQRIPLRANQHSHLEAKTEWMERAEAPDGICDYAAPSSAQPILQDSPVFVLLLEGSRLFPVIQ